MPQENFEPVPILLELLTDRSDPVVRKRLAPALLSFGGRAAVDGARRLLSPGEAHDVRLDTVWAFIYLRDDEDETVTADVNLTLINLMLQRDEDPLVRDACSQVLASLNHPDALGVLLMRLRRGMPDEAAAAAIAAVTALPKPPPEVVATLEVA